MLILDVSQYPYPPSHLLVPHHILGECRFEVHLPQREVQMGNLLPDHGLLLAPPADLQEPSGRPKGFPPALADTRRTSALGSTSSCTRHPCPQTCGTTPQQHRWQLLHFCCAK